MLTFLTRQTAASETRRTSANADETSAVAGGRPNVTVSAHNAVTVHRGGSPACGRRQRQWPLQSRHPRILRTVLAATGRQCSPRQRLVFQIDEA